jgi:hypothetical protein
MLQTAADREEAIERDPVVPVPIISARELLGEILLETNQPQQALSAFAASLKEKPGRFWSLWGRRRRSVPATANARGRHRPRCFIGG